MDLIHFIRFGYAILVISFLLMMWLSVTGAHELEPTRYPPCHFNPLCSCSKGVPDLGIVMCNNVQLPRIPETVNTSKVFMIHLQNNGLRSLEPYFLQSTGLYKIVISQNPLSKVSDDAFAGLERSLWELDLSYNQLAEVPYRSLRYLQKLRLLNLKGNHVAKVTPENWRGIENSLITLILAENSITNLPTDLFSGLPMVETIDLRGNNLKEIDPSVFRDGMAKLTTLILADNQLTAIPYQAVSFLKNLKTLDLSHNKINKMQPAAEIGVQIVNYNFQLNLDVIKLDYNQITLLEPASFQYFNFLNKTYLDGNPLIGVENNAFRQAKIREIYLRYCGLKEISPEAFGGLENYLEILDLSGNDITQLNSATFHLLVLLQSLNLENNMLNKVSYVELLNGFQFTLTELELGGSENLPVSIQDLKRLRNLRSLSLSRLTPPTLSPENFLDFGIDLEELEINYAGLQTIKNNAFKSVHGLKRIDFSDNAISSIENNGFSDIRHSLLILKLSHAFSTSMDKLPSDAIRDLENLEELDLSNNKIRTVPDTSFHFMRNLKRLYLENNIIETILKGTFQGDIHKNLNMIYLSFNNIKIIPQHTFVDLTQLQELHLDDNQLISIEKRAFMNLENLKQLNLKGNKITTIASEAFQNLPELENLDLSFNKLTKFEFPIFDQVGTLAMFQVNMSHNNLAKLTKPITSDLGGGSWHSNIKILDLSHNNISQISKQFFRPAEISLTHVYLAHNKLFNATKDVFGNMPHLQVLDLSHNILYDIDFDTFRNTKRIQLLSVSHNRIPEVPNDLFRFLKNLRIVDFSHNRLRSLPDNLFREEGLERLDLSHNLIGKLPLTSLSVASAMSLCELNLSWNSISSLVHGGLLSRFESLSWLDLSYNRLAQIDAGTFKGLPRLNTLDLGHNSQLALEPNGLSFQGLEYTLLHLYLDNVSLAHVPNLPTHNLLSLSLSHNLLPTVPPEMATNISSLQRLDLSYNDLTAVPIVTHSLNDLIYLSLRSNPISSLTNNSLLGVALHLEELDIRNINFTQLESGAFCKMTSLRTLKIDSYKEIRNLNFPRILQFSKGLRNLEINVNTEDDLKHEMQGEFPSNIRNITITGWKLKKLDTSVLQGIRSPYLYFSLRNTSVIKITMDLFKNIGWSVRNLTVDVRGNNEIKSLENPSTGSKPNLARRMFLLDLKVAGGKWSCDCDLGWIEVWQRKRHQYLCGDGSSTPSSNNMNTEYCKHTDDDLRVAKCANKNNQSLIEVLKMDIECGWSLATTMKITKSSFILFIFALSFLRVL